IALGKLKALYVMGENPVLGDPNVNHTIEAFKKLDLLIVQDIFLTETANLAHVVFPAATFAEKDGTFTNTERRIQRVRKALITPGLAKEDSWIISQLAVKLGYDLCYNSIEEVFDEMAQSWSAISGVSYSRLEKQGIQWPCPTKDHPGTEFLYKSGFPRGKVSFTPVDLDFKEEDKDYPLLLITGRKLFHYHYSSMTGKTEAINHIASEPYLEINKEDIQKYDLKDNQLIRVSSKNGSLEIKILESDRVKKGEVFIPLHHSKYAVNLLTSDAMLDTYSKTPQYRGIPVKIETIK
ncbi:MAG: molybdopterin-dependent oxidoreductase, partial [Thermodesulfovibrionales bacterium]|nr:molybdopterin-dependent oxidoreductase [Thermodesulfovibrionales bacterium]